MMIDDFLNSSNIVGIMNSIHCIKISNINIHVCNFISCKLVKNFRKFQNRIYSPKIIDTFAYCNYNKELINYFMCYKQI